MPFQEEQQQRQRQRQAVSCVVVSKALDTGVLWSGEKQVQFAPSHLGLNGGWAATVVGVVVGKAVEMRPNAGPLCGWDGHERVLTPPSVVSLEKVGVTVQLTEARPSRWSFKVRRTQQEAISSKHTGLAAFRHDRRSSEEGMRQYPMFPLLLSNPPTRRTGRTGDSQGKSRVRNGVKRQTAE